VSDAEREALKRDVALGDRDAGRKLAMSDLRCRLSRVDKIRKFIGRDVVIEGMASTYVGTLIEVSADIDAGPAELWLYPLKKITEPTGVLQLTLEQMEVTEEFPRCIPWDAVYSFGLAAK